MTAPTPKRDLVRDVQDLLRYEARGASIAPAVERVAREVATLQDELAALRKQVAILTKWHRAQTQPVVHTPWRVGGSPTKQNGRG